ncbi:MAG: HPF/RaiA family ribosome-associated protein [Thiohalocapsa sp.]|jgi:ribosome-associated translation inhibitor RaiA|nr:HPF/RaiA family ribosome-associated protein [Thiohalocapsa sp.]MCF7991884.1 HPF/RaiA family ribosome-associated protein [Thiohalocapsa sp.]
MSVRVTGDTLALDRKIVGRIKRQAETLAQGFPSQELDIQARIAEEFDELRGHRVRCELVTNSADRQQVVVREASKTPEEAIDAAFSGLKTKLRRLRTRGLTKQAKETAFRPTGT